MINPIQTSNTDSGYLGNDKPINQEPIINKINQKPDNKKMVIKLIIGLILIASAIALVLFGINKLLNPTTEIDSVNNSIDNAIESISENDFKEDLDIDYIEEGPMTENGKEIDDALKEIETMMVDINNQSDFQDIGNVNFSE
jgi:hypothetical protein